MPGVVAPFSPPLHAIGWESESEILERAELEFEKFGRSELDILSSTLQP